MVIVFAKSHNWRVLFLLSSVSKYHVKFLGNLCIMQMDEMFTFQ